MTTVTISYNPFWNFQYNGAPAVGFQLFTYAAGTTNKIATYTDSTGSVTLPNPILLNAFGDVANATGASSGLWTPPGQAYKYVLALPTDTDPPTSPIKTIDNITAPQQGLAANQVSYYGTDSGSVNAYVVTLSGSLPFALVTGELVRFTALTGNTGASTLNVAGTGAIAVLGQTGLALTGGEILSTGPTWVQWTGSAWQIVGTGAIPSNVRTAAEIFASVTPVNYAYAPYNVLRYGADPSGVASSSTAFNNAYNSAMAATPHAAIYIPAGKYLIPSTSPLVWTNQNDIRVYGDGMNNSVLMFSGSNYTILTISADIGSGTTGTNLTLANFGINSVTGAGVSALSLADYFQFAMDNMQLNSSGKSLKLAGMANGTCNNVTGITAGTNSAGDAALYLTTDTFGIGNGPITWNGCNFNGQSNVTVGGAIWSQKSFSMLLNTPLVTAFGPALTSVCAFTNADDVSFNEGYSESAHNTTNNNADLFDLGVTAACQNFKLNGGTYFTGAGGHTIRYGINSHNTNGLTCEDMEFAGLNTAGVKYTTTGASMIRFRNVLSSGAGNPPFLDSSIGGPASGFLKSWSDPWPRVDVSLGASVGSVTGDGTVYTVLFDTVNFDSTSIYAAGTGIATIASQGAGMYDVSAAVMVNGLTASDTGMEMDIVQKTAGGSVVSTHAIITNPGAVRNASNQAALSQNCLLKCSAGDQIYVTVVVSGSTKTVGVVGTGTEYTRMTVRYLG